MGTAGHVDHGKTALIEALTGIDCDTHKEEKKRGITINLGFAHMDLTPGHGIGIVDVPGHKDFVHTMVGGASGIDFVLMVIAADSGVMPQTREHLRVMDILGIKHGLIALTKTDLVEEPELLGLTMEDIREFVKGTFLENAPIIPVSAKTKQGLETLEEKILQIMDHIKDRPGEGIFRMFIDRVFSVSGFGTVVTGSVMSGRLRVKDNAYLLPGKAKELQVRRLERHGKDVSSVKAGDRASINLVGLGKTGVRKGMVIADRVLKETVILDAQLEFFENETNPALDLWSRVIFFAGTYESQARIHLIDKNKLGPGETALVQVHLQGPCVLRYGDRFVIRNSSGDTTLGGGIVIDVAPLFHRRRPGKLINQMTAAAGGKFPELIASEVRKSIGPVLAADIAFRLNRSVPEVDARIRKKLPADIVRYEGKNGILLFTEDGQEKMSRGILDAITVFRKQNPLVNRGASVNEIKGRLHIDKNGGEDVLKHILEKLTQNGTLIQKDQTWMTAVHAGTNLQGMESHMTFFSGYLKNSKMKTPLMSELEIEAHKRNLSGRELKQVLHNLTSSGEVYRVKDEYIHAHIVHNCREKLITAFSGREKGFTVAEFRDLVGGNRKICLLLLAQYDAELLTKRDGDLRSIIKNK